MPPYIKDRCEFRASSSYTTCLPPVTPPFRSLYADLSFGFRHRVDLPTELSRIRFVLCLVYRFLPGLRSRGCGNSSGRRISEKHHPLNHYIIYTPQSFLLSSVTPLQSLSRLVLLVSSAFSTLPRKTIKNAIEQIPYKLTYTPSS